MTSLSAATALGALLIGSASAMAATPALHSNTHTPQVNFAQRCSALSSQWKSAVDSHELSANLGKAKAEAAMGEKLCKSTTISDEKRGAGDYEAALKLLGVKPI